MLVKELIELLSKQNPEAEALVYSHIDEGFDAIRPGKVTAKQDAFDTTDQEYFNEYGEYPSHFYCKGYGLAEYFAENPNKDFVIVG